MATPRLYTLSPLAIRDTGCASVGDLLRALTFPTGFVPQRVPLYGVPVSAGFPSPADGYIESALDLNRHCIRNPLSTYFARVNGNGWGGLGVAEGDELVVDRALEPVEGSLVLADIDGTRSLFRAAVCGRAIRLTDGFDNAYGPESGFAIWGVVTFIIRGLR